MRFLLLLIVAALSLEGADIIVTNQSDVVNGDVSSPSALQTNPGADGVSLREAVLAATSAPGPHAIRLDASLAGQSIHLQAALPQISRDGISIAGPTDSAGQPLITILNAPGSRFPILDVRASRFTLCNLKFFELLEGGAVAIRTGRPPAPPNEITGLRIQGNHFKGLASEELINAVTFGVENGAVNGSITNVAIVSNTFVDIRNGGDSIGMGAGASVNGRLTDVFINDNLFLRSSLAVEIASSAAGGRVEHVYVERNTFLESGQAITLTGSIGLQGFPPAYDNVTRDIIIRNNFIASSQRAAFALVGALDASNNVLEDVEISNNIIAENRSIAIYITGGQSLATSAAGNRVGPLRIFNNTITGVGFASGVSAERNQGAGATGNEINDVRVVNTLFANQPGMGQDFTLEKQLVEASYCVTADPDRIGVNGNVSGDPRFVDRPGGDYHLSAGSVAIDAGTSSDAPLADRDGLLRRGAVDIGAFEFMGLRLRRRAVSRWDSCTP